MTIELRNNQDVDIWVAGDIPRGEFALIRQLFACWYDASPISAFLHVFDHPNELQLTHDPQWALEASLSIINRLPEPEKWLAAGEIIEELTEAISQDTAPGIVAGWHADEPGCFGIWREL